MKAEHKANKTTQYPYRNRVNAVNVFLMSQKLSEVKQPSPVPHRFALIFHRATGSRVLLA